LFSTDATGAVRGSDFAQANGARVNAALDDAEQHITLREDPYQWRLPGSVFRDQDHTSVFGLHGPDCGPHRIPFGEDHRNASRQNTRRRLQQPLVEAMRRLAHFGFFEISVVTNVHLRLLLQPCSRFPSNGFGG
jgi:hypothetical protein